MGVGGHGSGGRVWGCADASCCGLLYLTFASSICIFPMLFVGSSAHIVYFYQKCIRNILLFPALLTFIEGTVLHETNVVYVECTSHT